MWLIFSLQRIKRWSSASALRRLSCSLCWWCVSAWSCYCAWRSLPQWRVACTVCAVHALRTVPSGSAALLYPNSYEGLCIVECSRLCTVYLTYSTARLIVGWVIFENGGRPDCRLGRFARSIGVCIGLKVWLIAWLRCRFCRSVVRSTFYSVTFLPSVSKSILKQIQA